MALTKSLSFSLKRKRVLIDNNSCNLELFGADYESYSTPLKRFYSGDEQLFDEHISKETSTSSSPRDNQFFGEHFSTETSTSSSSLEDLPYEVLIKVICCVDHDDLKRLILVSKRVMEATLEAKESHFAYSTPSKTKVFRNSIDLVNNPMEFEEIEAPNAPNQARRKCRSPIDRKILDNIAVALFSDDEEQEQRWPRRSLFM